MSWETFIIVSVVFAGYLALLGQDAGLLGGLFRKRN